MAKLFNLAQMTTATLGQGTVTLVAAVAPFISFSAAGVIDGDVVAYSIIEGTNSEMGYGTYSSVGPTLTRNLRKSSTGALLVLAGSAIVRLSPGREDIINPDGSVAFAASLDMGSNKIITMADPSNPQDAATKNYVDNSLLTGTHAPVSLGTPNGLSLVNQVLSLGLVTGTSAGALSFSDWTTFNNKLAVTGSSTDNAIVRFDGTSSKLGQNSLATIDDNGNLNIPTGTTFNIGGVPHTHAATGGLVLLEQHSTTATGSSTLDFVTAITSAYDEYAIEIVSLLPTTNAVDFYIRFSTDGGSTFDSGNNYVNILRLQASSGDAAVNATLGGFVTRNNGEISNTSTKTVSGYLKLFSPLSTSLYKTCHGNIQWYGTSNNYINTLALYNYISTSAVNAIRFLFSSGNILSGTVRIYGLAK